jgi:hypothetical protein
MADRIFFSVFVLFLGMLQPAQAGETARDFLQKLYAAYAPNGKGNDFAYPEARAIVDDSLLALLQRGQQRSKGEVGALDSDPICQCQDWAQFKVLSIRVQDAGPKRAFANVDFQVGPTYSANMVIFDLVLQNGGWKIHDLSWEGTPSLQAYLQHYKY